MFAQKSVEAGLCNPSDLVALLNNNTTAQAEFSWALFEDLLFRVTNEEITIYDGRNNQLIDEYYSLNFRSWGDAESHAMALARYCDERNIRFVDREALRPGSLNKLTQYVNLHYAQVPIPPTIMGHGLSLLRAYREQGFGYPMIAKSAVGTRGQSNYLIKNEQELHEVLAKHDVAFVLQRFIPNKGDYRVLVTGDRVSFILHRQSAEGSHLNNTSQGGTPTPVPIESVNPEVIQLAVRASKYFVRDFGGVDIVEASDTGKFYCFEVNRSPQIEHTAFANEKAQVLADFLAED